MQSTTNGQRSFTDNPLTHLPVVPSVPQTAQEEYILFPSLGSQPEMFFVGTNNWHYSFTCLNEAIISLAELQLQQDPKATTCEPITGDLSDSDRSRVLELLQNSGKKLAEQFPVHLNNSELIAILDQEFPGKIWPSGKLSIATDPQMKEYLERRVAIQRKQPTPTPVQSMARQIKNTLYYELRYGNAVNRMASAPHPVLVNLKRNRKKKAA